MPKPTTETTGKTNYQVATTLPADLADLLTATARKSFSTRAIYIRNAIVSKMRADGLLPAESH